MGIDTRLVGNWEKGIGIGNIEVCSIPSGISLEELHDFVELARVHFERIGVGPLRGTIQLYPDGIKDIIAFLRSSRNEIIIMIDQRDSDPSIVSDKHGF